MEVTEMQTRLIEDARSYNPATHARTLLGPHRDALLMYRVKGLSYERIAVTLLRNGLKVSAPAVGIFCRQHFTKTEILRERRRREAEARRTAQVPGTATVPAGEAPAKPAVQPHPGQRGPKIARDDF